MGITYSKLYLHRGNRFRISELAVGKERHLIGILASELELKLLIFNSLCIFNSFLMYQLSCQNTNRAHNTQARTLVAVSSKSLAREPLIWKGFLVLAAQIALPGCTSRFLAVQKPQMRVFGAVSPKFQPPQSRSSRFRTRFFPVIASAAGQSSGSRSPEAAQATARSSPVLDDEPCRGRTPARDPERMLHPRARTLAFAFSALAAALPGASVRRRSLRWRPFPRMARQIAGVAPVPGRRRRRNDGGVNDAALLQQNPPLGQASPDLPNGRCASPRRSSRWRESGSSSRPEPSQAPPRQGAGSSRSRKLVLHRRVAWVAERLNAAHAQHRRQRMRLSPLAAALRTRRRNAGLQALPGDQAVHPLRKDLAALLARLAIALEAGKGQLPKALHVRIPRKKGAAQDSGHAPDAQ